MRRPWMCCVWVLAALLAAASVDAIPDPPALDPHFTVTKVPGLNENPPTVSNPSGTYSSNLFVQFRAQETILARDTELDVPASFVAQMGQAADSSPPARALRS